MDGNQAMEKVGQPTSFGEMIQHAPQPQGLTPTVVPLDRETLGFYANMITAAGLVPQENGVPPEMSKNRVIAKVVAGTSYGFDPVLSQQCFDVLFNRMTPNAHGMEILFRDSGEYDTRIKTLNDLECTVIVLQRQGGTWDESRGQYVGGTWHDIGEVRFTVEMAKKAGWTKNALWAGTPADMCYSKVMKRVVKRYNPTCLRPRMLLGNHFAKPQPQPPQITQSDAPQIEAAPAAAAIEADIPTAYVDKEYVEAPAYTDIDEGGEAVIKEYTGLPSEETAIRERPVATEPEEVEAEVVDPEESKLMDLRIAVNDAITSKIGGMPSDRKKFLKGKEVENESADSLRAMLADLENMP